MSRTRDRLFLSQNWHIDCRLIAELPEDSVVGIRFITYAVSSAIALAVVLFTGWYAYADFNLRSQIEDNTARLEDGHWDVVEIRRLQHFYEAESKKIESAYREIRTPIMISEFISEIGRTLPDRTAIDSIDYDDLRVVVRGRLRESSENSSITLGHFLDTLRADALISPYCTTINVTDLTRSQEDDQVMNYAITMVLKKRSI